MSGWKDRIQLCGRYAAEIDGVRAATLAEALRAYERLRVVLRDELGIAPSPDLQAVHRRLLRRADG